MTAVDIANVATTGTEGDVVASLLTALREAYLGNDIEGAEMLANQILMELGDDAIGERPKTTANARLILGWAMMNRALHTPHDLALLSAGVDEITSVHHILLERDDMTFERVMAECYMAYGAFFLGDIEACDRRMALVKLFVSTTNNVPAMAMYLQMNIIIRKLKGEDVDLPVLPPRETATEELATGTVAVTDDTILELDAHHLRLIKEVLAADNPEQMIDIIMPLIDQDPNRVTPESWFVIEHAHVWAHFRQAFSLQNLDERVMILEYILPYAQRLVDRALKLDNMRIFVPVGLDLMFAMHSLGLRQEAEEFTVVVCQAIHDAQNEEYREQLRETQDQIAHLYRVNGSRPVQAAQA